MKVIEGLYYSKEHEWVKVEGEEALIGITDYAQHALGDIVFVELPDAGASYEQEDTLGVVESVKAASDIYCPLTCEIISVNEVLVDEPQLLNENPYENYFAKVKILNPEQLDELMSSEEYLEFTKK